MVSFKKIAAAALMSATTLAVNVNCLVDGVSVATVDLDTGICPFTIPSSLPVLFQYTSPSAYDVEFYYVDVPPKYFTDIAAAGRVINIPARLLYGSGPKPLHQVHVTQTPSSNSTDAIRRRLMKETLISRDELSSFLTSIEGIEGTSLEHSVEVVLPSTASSSGAGSGSGASSTKSGSGSGVTSAPGGTVTATNSHTTVITITSCSDHKCVLTTVPATPSEVVTTIDETVTTYTTYCPLTGDETATVTHASTKIVTVTSCADNKCHETTVPATPSLVTTTVKDVATVYTTWCPVDTTETVIVESTEYYTGTTLSTSKGQVVTKTTVIPVVVESTQYYVPTTKTYTTGGSVVTATTVAPVAKPTTEAKTYETTVTLDHTTYVTATTSTKVIPGAAVGTTTTIPGAAAAGTTTTAPGAAAAGTTTTVPGAAAPGTTTKATLAAEKASETTITLQSTTYVSAVTPATVASQSTVVTTGKGSASTGAVTIPASANAAGASKASLLALIVIPLAYFI